MQNKKLLNLLLFFKKHKKLIVPIAILLVFHPLPFFRIAKNIAETFKMDSYLVATIVQVGWLLILGSSLIFLVYLSTQHKKGWLFYSLLVIFYPIYFFGYMFTDIYGVTGTGTGMIGLGMMIVLVPFYLTFSLVFWIVMKGIINKRRIKNKNRQENGSQLKLIEK